LTEADKKRLATKPIAVPTIKRKIAKTISIV
jgi:hypothetical protein